MKEEEEEEAWAFAKVKLKLICYIHDRIPHDDLGLLVKFYYLQMK